MKGGMWNHIGNEVIPQVCGELLSRLAGITVNKLPLLLALDSQLQAHHESLPAHTQNSFVHEEPLRLEDSI